MVSRPRRTYKGHFLDAVISTMLSGGLISLYAALLVFHPKPLWDSYIIVPTSGMLIGNAISGQTIAVDRLLSDVTEKVRELSIVHLKKSSVIFSDV